MTSEIGPDRILPAEAFTATAPDGAVKIRLGQESPDNYEPISVPTLVKKVAKIGSDHIALTVKKDDKWVKWTYNEYLKVST